MQEQKTLEAKPVLIISTCYVCMSVIHLHVQAFCGSCACCCQIDLLSPRPASGLPSVKGGWGSAPSSSDVMG
jgi:hypothetical protein